MVSNVSSSVGGWSGIGKSWAAGCGRSDGVWPLPLLRRELKYFLPFYKKIFVTFRRSSVSHLDLDLGVPIFPRKIMDYFSGGGVIPFWISQFELFHLFVEPCRFISFIRLVEARIEFPPSFPGLFRFGEQILSFGHILSLSSAVWFNQTTSLACHMDSIYQLPALLLL